MQKFDPITLQILWSRLVAIVDESAATLTRTAFSHQVREANDFACVLMDVEGNSLAQSSVSIPSFLSTLPITTKHFLKEIPLGQWEPGDVIIGNDPWMGTGHLHDISMVMPVYHQDEVVAIAGNVAHVPDIGGRIRSPDSKELFEEGIRIPVVKFMRRGEPNRDIVEVIRQNVRVPDQVMGDMMAQLTANSMASSRLISLLKEHDLSDVSSLAAAIHDQSERATRASIARLPDGSYHSELELDGPGAPACISTSIQISGSTIHVDFAGSSPQVPAASNSVFNYTYAYTVFALKCLLSPTIPANEGFFRPMVVTAPEGTIVNPRFPAAVGARMMTGHCIPAAVFAALAPALNGRSPAASGSPMVGMQLAGVDFKGHPVAYLYFLNGGVGAGPDGDGPSCLSFPGNTANIPVEVIESQTPLLVECKEMLPNSGGEGMFRGGLGQRLRVRLRGDHPLTIALLAERVRHPAYGLSGGGYGSPTRLFLNDAPFDHKVQRQILPGDVVEMQSAGGGGWGDPLQRACDAIARDRKLGFVREY